ncbi:hypothetical protein [Clostridioides difficile]|nr:hypothetical protein [Clostridioides difficile]
MSIDADSFERVGDHQDGRRQRRRQRKDVDKRQIEIILVIK